MALVVLVQHSHPVAGATGNGGKRYRTLNSLH
jgi:hypothetical protein